MYIDLGIATAKSFYGSHAVGGRVTGKWVAAKVGLERPSKVGILTSTIQATRNWKSSLEISREASFLLTIFDSL